MTKSIGAIIYSLVTILCGYFYLRSRKQKSEANTHLQHALFFSTIISAAYTITLLTNNILIMSIGNSIVFASIDLLLYTLCHYSIKYTKVKILLYSTRYFFWFFIPLDIIILLTNPWTNFALDYSIMQLGEATFLIFQPNLWFELHLFFCYILIAIYIIIYTYKICTSPKIYRIKYEINLGCIIFVVLLNAIFLFYKLPVDFSIFTYGLAAVAVYFFNEDYPPYQLIHNANTLIIQGMNNGVMLFDFEHKLITCNPIAKSIYKVNDQDFQTLDLHHFIESHKLPFDSGNNNEQSYDISTSIDGNQKWYHVNFHNMYDKKQKYLGSLLLMHDDTNRKLSLQQTEYMANHDYLTGLYNRFYYLSQKDTIIQQENYPISLVCWNINGLKIINDIYGNEKGDEAVKSVASVIQTAIDNNDLVFRFEGDEIIVLLLNTREKEAVRAMQMVQESICGIFINDIQVTAEFGVATIFNDETTLEKVYVNAKTIMTHKKMLNHKSLKSSIIESLKKSLKENNYDTEEHAERTSSMALLLGKRLGLSDGELNELELLAMLHDIGKLSIPDKILNKPTKLDDDEFEQIKMHTVKGYEIARITPELVDIAEYILHHHERWDGTGYPSQLKGEEIPLLSRIISIIDSHDVMTHDRVYHKAMTEEEAIAEIKRCSGTQFDPHIAKVFIELLEEIK